MRRLSIAIFATLFLAPAFVAAASAATPSDGARAATEAAHQVCLDQLVEWANSDVADVSDKPRQNKLLAEVETCLANGGLSQADLAEQYFQGKPPA